jgi:histidinol-phosphate/aromatic aminotransferase/cobyric acid decarboxylase-like protein
MIQPFSVPKIWVPTEFRVLGPSEDGRCNLAGCENCRISSMAIDAIRNPDPALLRDHWHSQDEGLRRAIAEVHRVAPGQVFLTSGAMGAIRYAFDVFTSPETHVGLLKPEWPGFQFFAERARARLTHLEIGEFPFRFDVDDVVEFVQRCGISFMIISNPSAVTGHLWDEAEIIELLASCPETFFVIDEADSIYPTLSAAHLANEHRNVLFLGSFSKFYGLSGLRIGYLVTPPAYVEDFDRTINPIEVTSLALVAAAAALADRAYQEETQRVVQENLRALVDATRGGPLRVGAESRCFATYLWAEEPYPDPFVTLAAQGISIAPGTTFGLRRGGRVNLSDAAAIKTLIEALPASVVERSARVA